MARFLLDFDFWCKEATQKIKYRPDRQDVYSELHQHLQDRYQDFIDQGMEPEEATQKALQVMGDAKELAPMLAAIHRPFWGYMYSLCKWVFFLSLIIMLYNLLPWLSSLSSIVNTEGHVTYIDKFNVYTDTEYEDDHSRWERILYQEKGVQQSSDGYIFSIERVTLWQETLKNPNDSQHDWWNEHRIWIELKVTNLRPWTSFTGGYFIENDALNWFWAEDSLGNYYYSSNEYSYSYVPYIGMFLCHKNLFTQSYIIFMQNYVSKDAEWIDLHYDRSDRDVTLRIDLTGGDGNED